MISKIPNSDLTRGGDNTLSFSDPDYANVLGYRFVTIGDEASYLFIGFYDATNAAYVPYIIVIPVHLLNMVILHLLNILFLHQN